MITPSPQWNPRCIYQQTLNLDIRSWEKIWKSKISLPKAYLCNCVFVVISTALGQVYWISFKKKPHKRLHWTKKLCYLCHKSQSFNLVLLTISTCLVISLWSIHIKIRFFPHRKNAMKIKTPSPPLTYYINFKHGLSIWSTDTFTKWNTW